MKHPLPFLVAFGLIFIMASATAEGADKFSKCRKFLGYKYDVNFSKDEKKTATTYLNAALDIFESSYDKKITPKEIEERNACTQLALESGADPDAAYSSYSPAPIVRAVRDNNEAAVKLLLEHHADPNALDTTMGDGKPLLNAAIYGSSQNIALQLIEAGADLSTPHLLWIAAGNAADKMVEVMIKSKKIPVNQLNKFSDYSDEAGQTALDVSESHLFAINKYFKKLAEDPGMSPEEKLYEANGVLYYSYPLKGQLRMKDGIDPDAVISDLLTRQQNVSRLLKDAGWTCNEENCGIIDFSSSK